MLVATHRLEYFVAVSNSTFESCHVDARSKFVCGVCQSSVPCGGRF